MIEFRALDRDDVPALATVMNARLGTSPAMSGSAIAAQLFGEERGHGANTRVAIADGAVAGSVSWLVDGDASFLAPLIASRADVAAALLEIGIAEATARGAAWIRVSGGTEASPRSDAIAAAGFAPVFDFIDVVRPVLPVDIPDLSPLAIVPMLDVDRDRLRDLNNTTFDGVPNSLPISRKTLDEVLALPVFFPAASNVAVAPDGELVGFLIGFDDVTAAGRLAIVDSVGVLDSMRGRGVGRALVLHLIAAAAAGGIPEAYAAIASTNTASLALHSKLGFTERWRRRVWQRDLK